MQVTKVFKIACILIAAAILTGSAAITWSGLTDHIHPADVCLVPACKLGPDGNPGPALRARLDKTVELYRKGMFPRLIVSGGVDRHGWDEAAAMKQYLARRGVAADKIWTDNKGTNTYFAARNTARIMTAHKMKSVLVVTQYFHVPRTRLALEHFGVSPVYSVHATFFHWRDFWWVPRDAIGYCYYRLRPYPKGK